MTLTFGTNSRNRSTRLEPSAPEIRHRSWLHRADLKLATRPRCTGSSAAENTIGRVDVADLAASVAALPVVTINATWSFTNSLQTDSVVQVLPPNENQKQYFLVDD
jgi:hypothetical protein